MQIPVRMATRGLLLAGAALFSGFALGTRTRAGLTIRPPATSSALMSPSIRFAPTVSPVPALLSLQRSSVLSRWSTKDVRGSPTPADSGATRNALAFLTLPSSVRANQPFTVQWRVDGPPGAVVQKTTLEVRTSVASSTSGGWASSSSTSQQTFGSVPAPHIFSATLSFGGNSRSVFLSATAIINGSILSAGPVSLPILP